MTGLTVIEHREKNMKIYNILLKSKSVSLVVKNAGTISSSGFYALLSFHEAYLQGAPRKVAISTKKRNTAGFYYLY